MFNVLVTKLLLFCLLKSRPEQGDHVAEGRLCVPDSRYRADGGEGVHHPVEPPRSGQQRKHHRRPLRVADDMDPTEAGPVADVLDVGGHIFGADLIKAKMPEAFALWVEPEVAQTVAAASAEKSKK